MDDCCKALEPVYAHHWLHRGQRHRTRQTALALSELLTLLVYFHWRHYRTLKHDSLEYVAVHLRPSFPHLVRSARFVEDLPRALVPWCGYLATRKGRCTGMACIDSTPLAVCDNHRIATPPVFEGVAARGKTSMGGATASRCIASSTMRENCWPCMCRQARATIAARSSPSPLDWADSSLGLAATWRRPGMLSSWAKS